MPPAEQRPPLLAVISGAELRRWCWTLAELDPLARRHGLPRVGGERHLTAVLEAHLDGQEPPGPPEPRVRPAAPLPAPLSQATVLPRGRRCTQQVRAWMVEQVGPSFRDDRPVRESVAAADGTTTLGDLRDHGHATRDRGPEEIAPQPELNRLVRAHHEQHPGATHSDALAAWREHRAGPRPEAGGPVTGRGDG